ncbi:preprotein translocase subunit SecE [Actinoplanes sp. G11-F43]|uniref:preprotein translocase subunit SecE n=1 Tax=Actinoplanes sp. G11-F43 TaxID=3424130 RepID=UPI003D326525
MAEKDRPGDDVPGDDEVLADAAAGGGVPDDDADESRTRDGGTAVAERSAEEPSKKRARGKGPIGRVGGFFREVTGELRKVIWPTRKELLTYTGVVIVFVVIMTALVAGLDYGFGKAILAALG